jgi:hypothetical protein
MGNQRLGANLQILSRNRMGDFMNDDTLIKRFVHLHSKQRILGGLALGLIESQQIDLVLFRIVQTDMQRAIFDLSLMEPQTDPSFQLDAIGPKECAGFGRPGAYPGAIAFRLEADPYEYLWTAGLLVLSRGDRLNHPVNPNQRDKTETRIQAHKTASWRAEPTRYIAEIQSTTCRD